MLESTRQKYLKNANGFLNRHFRGGKSINMHMILSKMDEVSPSYHPKSFTNLKACLALWLEEKEYLTAAEKVRSFKNRNVKLGNTNKPIKKVKSIAQDEQEKIEKGLAEYKNNCTSDSSNIKRNQVIAAYLLAKELGCRPVEMPNIKRTGKIKFLITGAKKDEFGLRGLDRELEVDSQEVADLLENAIKYLKDAKMSQIQDRFKYLMKKTFPRKRKLPTLYTLRHQLASNLKSSGKYAYIEMAYILGHQSTRTLENYGYANAGRGSVGVKPVITTEEIELMIRDSHQIREKSRISRLSAIKTSEHSKTLSF
jgi:integrase